MDGEGQVHRGHATGGLAVLVLLGGLGGLLALLVAGGVAPQIGAAVHAGDVKHRDAL